MGFRIGEEVRFVCGVYANSTFLKTRTALTPSIYSPTLPYLRFLRTSALVVRESVERLAAASGVLVGLSGLICILGSAYHAFFNGSVSSDR